MTGVISTIVGWIVVFLSELIATPADILGLNGIAYGLRFRVNTSLERLESWEQGINTSFAEGVQEFTEPFDGWLLDIANGLYGIESAINEVADVGLVAARALDPTIAMLRNTDIDYSVFGQQIVDIQFDWLASIFQVFDVILDIFMGGAFHAFFSAPAALAGWVAVLFEQLAGLTPIEAISGFIGGIILLLLLTIAVPTIIFGILEVITKFVAYGFRWGIYGLRSLWSSDATPPERTPSKIVSAAAATFISNLARLAILTGIMIPFLLYPFENLLGILFLAALSLLFLVIGELEDDGKIYARLYAYGLILSVIAVPGFFFELGFGLTGVVLLFLATIISIAWTIGYVDENAIEWANETSG